MAARKRSWLRELRRLALRMLKAKLRSLAKTPGLMRMLHQPARPGCRLRRIVRRRLRRLLEEVRQRAVRRVGLGEHGFGRLLELGRWHLQRREVPAHLLGVVDARLDRILALLPRRRLGCGLSLAPLEFGQNSLQAGGHLPGAISESATGQFIGGRGERAFQLGAGCLKFRGRWPGRCTGQDRALWMAGLCALLGQCCGAAAQCQPPAPSRLGTLSFDSLVVDNLRAAHLSPYPRPATRLLDANTTVGSRQRC